MKYVNRTDRSALISLIILFLFVTLPVVVYSATTNTDEHSIKIYADPSDGISKYLGVAGVHDWNDVRNNQSGNQYNDSMTVYYKGILAAFNPKGGSVYVISRSYFRFDTSVISDDAVLHNASLHLYGAGANESRVCIVSWSDGDDGVTYDDYSHIGSVNLGRSTHWKNDGYNTIYFNELGLEYINVNGETDVCLREYDHDFRNISPNNTTLSEHRNGHYFSDEPGTDKDPYLYIEYTSNTTDDIRANDTAYPSMSMVILMFGIIIIATIILKKKRDNP